MSVMFTAWLAMFCDWIMFFWSITNEEYGLLVVAALAAYCSCLMFRWSIKHKD